MIRDWRCFKHCMNIACDSVNTPYSHFAEARSSHPDLIYYCFAAKRGSARSSTEACEAISYIMSEIKREQDAMNMSLYAQADEDDCLEEQSPKLEEFIQSFKVKR